MRRIAILLFVILTIPLLVVASPDSTVEIKYERKIANMDIGINGGAVSPLGETVLLFGAEGYAHLISTERAGDKSLDVSLENETTEHLHAASWHPAGKSALIVGESGVVLRYNSTNYGLSEAEGSFAMSGKDIRAVQFTPGSSVAYLGTDDGQIWKYYADTFEMINNEATSRVTDISCMKNENICLISTVSDGIAVVDQADTVTWLSNTRFDTWIGLSCADPFMTSCTAFASGKKTAEIDVDTQDSEQSSIGEITIIGELEGDFVAVDEGHDSSTIVGVGPMSLLRYTQYTQKSFLMFSNKDATDNDVYLGGDSYGFAWENSKNSGFLVTSYGRVVSFSPAEEETAGFVPGIVIFLIAISVPGVFIGMIYWNSPWLQKKYAQLFKRNKSSKK